MPGETFASRVSGSFLTAAGVPELITSLKEEYEALALGLARDPSRLVVLREKLARNRATAPFSIRLRSPANSRPPTKSCGALIVRAARHNRSRSEFTRPMTPQSRISPAHWESRCGPSRHCLRTGAVPIGRTARGTRRCGFSAKSGRRIGPAWSAMSRKRFLAKLNEYSGVTRASGRRKMVSGDGGLMIKGYFIWHQRAAGWLANMIEAI